MPRNSETPFKPPRMTARLKGPRAAARMVVGALLAANLVAAVFALHPWGGGPEDLRRRQLELRRQVGEMQTRLAQARALVSKVQQGRTAGDDFLGQYITERRSTFSSVMEELNGTAKEAGIKQKEYSIVLEPVEGSDSLSQMTIAVGYEGTYQNLTKFVNLLDKSKRFLIIENMVASPQQATQLLNVSFKLDTFVRESPGSAS